MAGLPRPSLSRPPYSRYAKLDDRNLDNTLIYRSMHPSKEQRGSASGPEA
jgi:hypothetical protein